MPSKLYRVNVSKDIYVLADSQEDAEDMAKLNVGKDLAKWKTSTFLINSCAQLPDHVLNSLFWGTNENITIQQFLLNLHGDMELQ